MNISAGKILTSTDLMDDPNFRNTTILIAEHNENGALGFVLNKVFERPLNELEEFSTSPRFPLYQGGPVDPEHLYFVHRRHDIITEGTLIINDIYLGGDFKKAISAINNQSLTTADIKIFIGYCGWDINELEEEIAEGSWQVQDISFNLFS